MQTSRYVRAVPAIVADMQRAREEADDQPQQPDQQDEPGSGAGEKMFVYRTDTGGWLLSPTKIQEREQDLPLEEDEQPQPPIIDSQKLETDQSPPTRRPSPYFLHF